jgi:hypothetical protein
MQQLMLLSSPFLCSRGFNPLKVESVANLRSSDCPYLRYEVGRTNSKTRSPASGRCVTRPTTSVAIPHKAQQKLPHWQAAVEALIMAAENRGPLLHARADMLKAMTQKSRLARLKKSGVVQGYGVVRGLHEQVIARTIRPEEAKPAILQISLHSSSRHFTL